MSSNKHLPSINEQMKPLGPWDFILEMEVRDYELDSQGIVNNATYLNYYEHCRHRYLDYRGIHFTFLQEQGIDPVVSEVRIKYLHSLRSRDSFFVYLLWLPKGRFKQQFKQEIRLPEGTLVSQADFTVATLIHGKIGFSQQLIEMLETNGEG
jgi:acyl-CoA thioester hydrolase